MTLTGATSLAGSPGATVMLASSVLSTVSACPDHLGPPSGQLHTTRQYTPTQDRARVPLTKQAARSAAGYASRRWTSPRALHEAKFMRNVA